jgi:hypothetical protein
MVIAYPKGTCTQEKCAIYAKKFNNRFSMYFVDGTNWRENGHYWSRRIGFKAAATILDGFFPRACASNLSAKLVEIIMVVHRVLYADVGNTVKTEGAAPNLAMLRCHEPRKYPHSHEPNAARAQAATNGSLIPRVLNPGPSSSRAGDRNAAHRPQ